MRLRCLFACLFFVIYVVACSLALSLARLLARSLGRPTRPPVFNHRKLITASLFFMTISLFGPPNNINIINSSNNIACGKPIKTVRVSTFYLDTGSHTHDGPKTDRKPEEGLSLFSFDSCAQCTHNTHTHTQCGNCLLACLCASLCLLLLFAPMFFFPVDKGRWYFSSAKHHGKLQFVHEKFCDYSWCRARYSYRVFIFFFIYLFISSLLLCGTIGPI